MSKAQRVRVGHMVWAIRYGIVLGMKWEKECNLSTGEGRADFVDKRMATGYIRRHFPFVDYTEDRRPYVSDVLRAALKDAIVYVYHGSTPQ